MKHVEQLTEQQKISLRKVRQGIKKDLKALEASKDEKKGIEKKLDTLTKDYSVKIDQMLEKKKADLLTK